MHSGQKIRSGKLWMKCVTPETDESTSRKNNIFEKHKRHSKTLRKKQMLKQDENALNFGMLGIGTNSIFYLVFIGRTKVRVLS